MPKNKTKNKSKNKSIFLPFVSICTPTFNRRPFYPIIIECFNKQTYPKDKIEWIIIDDGTDKIEDLVKDIPQVKYFKYDTVYTNYDYGRCTMFSYMNLVSGKFYFEDINKARNLYCGENGTYYEANNSNGTN
jgi:cellulose synthase/poly-beta-1,6-N-acetylglucosamine synthase-like glycosyltransferase